MKSILLFLFFITSILTVSAQDYPHIHVRNEDKIQIQNKIKEQPWAAKIFVDLQEKLSYYVDKHTEDPNWILDRYLMNRIPGKRYTRFISDKDGTKLIGYEGDAPVPTIRVSPHKRAPVTPQGGSYRTPQINELVPNDTSMLMNLYNPATGEYERIDPQRIVGTINGEINNLAYSAAVVFWLTGEEKYARFSADILNQWVTGAAYQEPIEGPLRTGFLDIQTLGDEQYKSLILAYDFLYTYLASNNYPLENYNKVFEKIASTMAFRGYTNNNWYAAESSTLVAAALAMSDKQKRDYYLDFYLNRDTVNDGHGQLALPSTMNKWFTPDGHWKEPGGYHNYPVSKLIESALMLENNGIQVFANYPKLLDAAYVMLKYSFPDLTASAFGDTGRPMQSPYCLEAGIKMAIKYNLPVQDDLIHAIHLLQERGIYDRSKGGIEGLLCYLPEIPERKVETPVLWNRSEKLDFASCFLQRNGMNELNGLMFVLQGASYNHNHSNGMAMELYGKGTVMGIDPGNGPNYEHPAHVEYYTQWAAHNTVIAGGASYSLRPFRGGGGQKDIGKVNLIAMEPLAGEKAVSDDYSFVSSDYYERSTRTKQSRTLALIRTSDTTGYYLDIYRSDNPLSNDYIYHNIGDNVCFYTPSGDILPVNSLMNYPVQRDDKPGLRYFKEVETTGFFPETIIALFSVDHLKSGKAYMKMWMPASDYKAYYQALAPGSKTAVFPYKDRLTPTIAIRQEKPAVDNPFIVVYEPTDKGLEGSIHSVQKISSEKYGDIVRIEMNGEKTHTVFNANTSSTFNTGDFNFVGNFGIISEKQDEICLYLGKGLLLENGEFKIETMDDINGSVSLRYTPHKLFVSTRVPVSLTVKKGKIQNKSVLSFQPGEYEILIN